jgi:photosystem II stability/assembly factor-like uncharacterized protein
MHIQSHHMKQSRPGVFTGWSSAARWIIPALFGLLSVCSPPVIRAQWMQSGGPGGGLIQSFKVSRGNVFAGTDGGVYRSTDGGLSWTEASSGLGGKSVLSFASIGDNLFAGSIEGGIYLTTDEGATWFPRNSETSRLRILALCTLGTSAFAGTAGDGLFASRDTGATWVPVAGGFRGRYVTLLFADDSALYAATSDSGLFRSMTGGTSWTHIDLVDPFQLVFAFTRRADTLFASTVAGILLSTDRGSHWSDFNAGFPPTVASALVILGPYIFAGTGLDGVLFSSVNSASWTKANHLLGNLDVNAIDTSGSRLFAGTGSGVFFSTNLGASWEASTSGMIASAVTSMIPAGPYLFAGTSGGGVYRSVDNGANWNEANSGLPWPYIGSLTAGIYGTLTGDTVLFAGTLAGNGVFLSTDLGGNWVHAGLTGESIHSLAVEGKLVFAGSDDGMFVSPDRGSTWTAIDSGLTAGFVQALDEFDNCIYAGTEMGGAFVSTNDGLSWSPADSGLTSMQVTQFANIGPLVFASTYGGVFASKDSGKTWIARNAMLPDLNINSMLSSGTSLFAGSTRGVYTSGDSGRTWKDVTKGFSDYPRILELALKGTYLYAGTAGSGVWRRPLAEMVTGTSGYTPRLADRISLFQNYPNPFNPSTTIRYALAKRSRVTLNVFNTLGQEVVALVNEVQDAGYHEAKFDGTGLASGVYIYRLIAGGHTLSKRLVLLR